MHRQRYRCRRDAADHRLPGRADARVHRRGRDRQLRADGNRQLRRRAGHVLAAVGHQIPRGSFADVGRLHGSRRLGQRRLLQLPDQGAGHVAARRHDQGGREWGHRLALAAKSLLSNGDAERLYRKHR